MYKRQELYGAVREQHEVTRIEPLAVGFAVHADGRTFPARAVLLATGLIVGEAIMGVIYAGVVVATGNGSVLDVIGDSSYGNYADYVGLIVIALMTWGVYSRVKKMAVARENASTSQ